MGDVGTILAIIQISDRVAGLCKHWIETVRDAPADFRSILIETSLLKIIFENIQFLVKHDNGMSKILNSLAGCGGPVEHCLRVLQDLEKLLPSDYVLPAVGQKGKSKRRKAADALGFLAWPLKESKARKLLDELVRYKTSINLALSADSAQDTKAIKKTAGEIHDMLTDSQCWEVFRWLEQTDPSPSYNKAHSLIESGTCQWILRTPEWTDWLTGTVRFLWVHGIPGAGKTILSAFVIDELEKHFAIQKSSNCIVIYYYCYFGHNQDESRPFLRWLICQLCRKSTCIPVVLYELFQSGCEPRLSDLLNALEVSLEPFDTAYVVLDAVDESKPRDDQLKTCRDLVTDARFQKVRLLATSRLYFDIEETFDIISKPISMSNPFITDDIRCYVAAELKNNKKFRHWPEKSRPDIEKALSEKAHGMFRWAVCQIDRLSRLRYDSEVIKRVLTELPKTLDETYERIFEELPEENRELVRNCLRWIEFHSIIYGNGIPCKLLLQAVLQSTYKDDEDVKCLRFDEEILRESCGCLISTSLGPGYEQGVGFFVGDDGCPPRLVVSFAHYTVREFLGSARIQNRPAAYYSLTENIFVNDLISDLLRAASSYALEEGAHFHKLDGSESEELWIQKSWNILETDFAIYSVISGVYGIQHWAKNIVHRPDLLDDVLEFVTLFTEDYFDVYGHAKLFIDANFMTCRYTDGIARLYETKWITDTHDDGDALDAVVLFYLLNLHTLHYEFAERFLEAHGGLELISKATLRFRSIVFEPIGDLDIYGYFEGNIVEIFAQLVCWFEKVNEDEDPLYDASDLRRGMDKDGDWIIDPLTWILTQNLNFHNPTGVLVSYLASRYHCGPRKPTGTDWIVEKLLERGADPNGSGYRISPLQLAAAARDSDCTRILLEAGAEPNHLGDPTGVQWKPFPYPEDRETQSVFGVLTQLEGIHPLSAVEFGYNWTSLDGRGPVPEKKEKHWEDRKRQVITLLLQHGAVK